MSPMSSTLEATTAGEVLFDCPKCSRAAMAIASISILTSLKNFIGFRIYSVNARIKCALNLENGHLRVNLYTHYFQIINRSSKISQISMHLPAYIEQGIAIQVSLLLFTLRPVTRTDSIQIFYSCVLY